MLRVALLGEQVITDDATGAVRTRSSRTIALIGFLALHGGSPQTRQRVAGLFWPDSTGAQALTNLRREVHQLRRDLGDVSSLVVTSRDLTWHDTPECTVDLRTFAAARDAALAADSADDTAGVLASAAAALAQYRGELLPGCYDEWVAEPREELQHQCAELCDLLRDARTRTGDLAGAVSAARRRIALQPLDEAGYRFLMELQADLGDRAGAVSTYHHCASVLERELGVEPDRTTRATLQRLMSRRSDPPPGSESTSARSGFAGATFVGRDKELDRLRGVWHAAASGRPSLVLVRGDPGVGKTRLVGEIAGAARLQGATVASTQCFGTSGRLALAPVADWLRTPTIQAAVADLDPVWRTEVERLVPTGPAEPAVGARAMVDAWQRHRFFEGLSRAVISVDRPTLLVLDNVQWCDQETLAFLTFCLGLTPDARLLVAGTLREASEDTEPELGAWIARMRATGMLSEVPIAPLEVEHTAALAAGIAGRPVPEAEAELLQATTGGYPLYVVEAVRAGVEAGTPGDLATVLGRRLDQVSAAAREIAGLASAVGRDFTLDLLTEASDFDADTVVRAVDELWRSRIVHEIGEGYDFSHDLVRDAAYETISPPKRWLLHRRIAQSLEILHAADTDAVSVQLAEQYARGGRTERAVENYRRAAEVAATRFAHGEAIRLHRQALDLMRTLPAGVARDRTELAVLEGMAAPLNAWSGYASPALEQTLERSIALAETLGNRDAQLNGLLGLWTCRFVQGRIADSYRTVSRALAMVETDADAARSGDAHFACGGATVTLGRPAEALRHFEIAAGLPRGELALSVGTRLDVQGTAWSAHARWLLGDADGALASSVEAIRLARTIGHPYNLAMALAYGGITHQLRGEVAELGDVVAELGELSDRYRFAYYREWGLVLGGWARGGDDGLRLARKGIDNLKAEGAFARMPYWLALVADVQTRVDRPGAARATLDAALAAAAAQDDLWWQPEVMRMRAAYDDGPAAVSRLQAAVALAASQGSVALVRRCEADLQERGLPSVR